MLALLLCNVNVSYASAHIHNKEIYLPFLLGHYKSIKPGSITKIVFCNYNIWDLNLLPDENNPGSR